MLVNETRDLGEPSFPELGRNHIFIEVMVIILLIFIVSFNYKSCKDIKLIIVTFYNYIYSLPCWLRW